MNIEDKMNINWITLINSKITKCEWVNRVNDK